MRTKNIGKMNALLEYLTSAALCDGKIRGKHEERLRVKAGKIG